MNKRSIFEKQGFVILFAACACALWGSAPTAIKAGYEAFGISSLDSASQIIFAGLRFVLAGLLTVLMGSVGQKKLMLPKKSSIKSIILLCIPQTVLQYFFYYIGVAHTAGVHTSIITGSNTFIGIFLACFIFRTEKLTAAKLFGSILGFCGVVIVAFLGGGNVTGDFLFGDIMVFISATAFAMSSVCIKFFSQKDDPVMLSGYQFILGGFVLFLTGIGMGGSVSLSSSLGIAILLYLAFVSAGAFTLWGLLLKYNPVSKVLVLGFMNPVFGVIIASIVLNEIGILGPYIILSLILVCAGIYIANRTWHGPKAGVK